MKTAKMIIIAATAMAIGAVIPTVKLLQDNCVQLAPLPDKGISAAVTTTAAEALPVETTFSTAKTTAAVTTATTAASQYVAENLTVTTVPMAVTAQTAISTTAAAVQTTAAQTAETAPAAPAQKPAAKPVPAPIPAPVQEEPAVVNGSDVTYKGKKYSKDLAELDLSGKKMTEADLSELKEAVSQFDHLQKIILCDCGLSNETLAAFQDEIGIRVVWRVKLGTQWSLRTDAVAFSVLIMNYKHIRMTSADLEVLKYCPDLRALDLGHQAITDLSKIAEYLPELRLLILADNQISDLSPLANLKHLHYLELFVNRVSDLSPLAGLNELVDVNISYNPISDISPLLNAPMMQRVWLESTNVNADGVDQLRETYPEAKIVNVGKGSVDQGWRWGNARYEQMMDMWYNNYYGSEFQKYDDLAVSLGLRG